MLDEKDLHLLKTMMQEVVSASEARMTAKIEESIAASEARMTAKIEESTAASESKMMAYIECDILPRFDILADGHKILRETLAAKSEVEELREDVAFLKPLVLSTLADVEKLKKAQ